MHGGTGLCMSRERGVPQRAATFSVEGCLETHLLLKKPPSPNHRPRWKLRHWNQSSGRKGLTPFTVRVTQARECDQEVGTWTRPEPCSNLSHTTRTYLLRPNRSPQIREDSGTTSLYITHLGKQGTEGWPFHARLSGCLSPSPHDKVCRSSSAWAAPLGGSAPQPALQPRKALPHLPLPKTCLIWVVSSSGQSPHPGHCRRPT